MRVSICKLVLIFATLMCTPATIYASDSLVFSEIMYDVSGTDVDHEWVEIKNIGTNPVVIVGGNGAGSFRFNDGSNHILSATADRGSMTIPAGGYAILSGNSSVFLLDHPDFSGTVIDTTMSLGNDSDTIILLSGDGNTLSSVTYTSDMGGAGDGNSIFKNESGLWVGGIPTPGRDSDTSSNNDTGNGSGGSGTTQLDTKEKKVAEIPKIKAEIDVAKNIVAGIPVKMSGNVYWYDGSLKTGGIFSYSFGDGTEYKTQNYEKFDHTYTYKGTYVITFSYRTSQYQLAPEITTHKTVYVSEPTITITSIDVDGTVTIKNPTDEDADISNWIVRKLDDYTNQYPFPEGMMIVSGGLIYLPSSITKLSLNQSDSVELVLPSGRVVSSFIQVERNESSKNQTYIPVQSDPIEEKPLSNTNQEDGKNEITGLEARVLTKDNLKNLDTEGRSSIWPFALGMLGVVATSIFALNMQSKKENTYLHPLSVDESQTKKIADSIRIIDTDEDS